MICSHQQLLKPENLTSTKISGKCFPVKVLHSDDVGNYFVSTRDLNPLDVILRDWALPSGPQHDPTPVCLTCYTKINPTSFVECSGKLDL